MRTTLLRAGIPAAALVAGCGGSVETSPNGNGGGATTTSTSTVTSTTSTTSTTSSAGCTAIVDAIAANMKGPEACTATVRLDYVSRAILGFAVTCAPYHIIDESTARATAQADTGQGQSGQLLGPPPPEDAWVFWQPAGDFGGSAAVAARSGTSVFGGTTVWSGMGDITHPKAWQPPSAVGVGCGQVGISVPPARGFDLGSGAALAKASVDAALAVVWETAIPLGLLQGGYLFDGVVLLYPRSVGAFDPASAEWIVLVDSGWLE